MSKLKYFILISLLSSSSFAFEDDDYVQQLEKRVVKLENQLRYVMESTDVDRLNELEQKLVSLQSKIERSSKNNQANAVKKVTQDESLQKIKALIKRQDYRSAQQNLERFIQDHKKDESRYEAYYYLGDIYITQGDILKAEPLFDKVSEYKQHPLAPDALLRLTTIYWQTGRQDKAKKSYNTLLQRYPSSSVSQLAKTQYHQWIDAK